MGYLRTWTQEADDTLITMRGEGYPYSTIAARLGKSKNACVGRGHRLGIRTAKRATAVLETPVKAVVVATPKPEPAPQPIIIIPEPPPGPRHVPLIEMTGCKWPTSEDNGTHLFCNAPKGLGPYCRDHHRLSVAAYTPWGMK